MQFYNSFNELAVANTTATYSSMSVFNSEQSDKFTTQAQNILDQCTTLAPQLKAALGAFKSQCQQMGLPTDSATLSNILETVQQRKRTGQSQKAIAEAFNISVAAVKQVEQMYKEQQQKVTEWARTPRDQRSDPFCAPTPEHERLASQFANAYNRLGDIWRMEKTDKETDQVYREYKEKLDTIYDDVYSA